MSELNLILLGPPGAGKGTQADKLKDDFGLPYIGTGDLLRKHRKEETELGREAASYMEQGRLVPDELVIRMILDEVDAKGADGFPRTTEQADALSSELEGVGRRLTAALLIEVPDEVVVKRLSGRRQCTKGHLYHVDFDPPKHEGFCDQDGSPLIQRDDDKPETVKHRLEVYHDQTRPLIEHYEDLGLLKRFDGKRPPGDVHDHIRATLATLRLEDEL